MLGAIAGDIIGSYYEFHKIKTKEFELFHPESKFTDDTTLSMAIAKSIVDDEPYLYNVIDFGLRYFDVGYGSGFKKWLKGEEHKPYNSWGNGSAMRVSAVAWAFETEEKVLEEARKSAEITHNHPEGIKGAEATAFAIFWARKGLTKALIREKISEKFDYDLTRTVDEIRPEYKFEVSCAKSVPESIICFLDSDSFEDAIRNAISLGGDADTMGAIAGSIAEAYYGIPKEIEEKIYTYLPEEFKEILEKFQKKSFEVFKKYALEIAISEKDIERMGGTVSANNLRQTFQLVKELPKYHDEREGEILVQFNLCIDLWQKALIRHNGQALNFVTYDTQTGIPLAYIDQDLVAKAWFYASKAHQEQKYPRDDLPYITHIGNVVLEVMAVSPWIRDENLAIVCAILHDTIEDTTTTYEELLQEFSKEVADGVMALSKDETLTTKKEQMLDSLKRIKKQPKEIWTVKMADRIANLGKPPYYWKKEKIKAYQEEAELIYTYLCSANPILAERLEKKIVEYDRYLN